MEAGPEGAMNPMKSRRGKPRNKLRIKQGWDSAPEGYYPHEKEIFDIFLARLDTVKSDLSMKVDNKGMGATAPRGVCVWRPHLDVDKEQQRMKLPLLPLVQQL